MGTVSKRFILMATLVTVVILFAWGVVSLALIRFEQGDNISPYSSFRADPLGSRGLFGSIDKLPGVSARRHLRPLNKLEGADGETVMVLGLPATVLVNGNQNLEQQLLRLASEGSRVLIAAKPPTASFLKSLQRDQEEEAEVEQVEAASEEVDDKMAPVEDMVEEERPEWGLAFFWQPVHEELAQLYSATRAGGKEALPAFLDVHTPLVMADESGFWTTVYNYGSEMVVAEREWGKGSLLVFVDAYPFSNEALRTEAEVELLAWALGGAQSVVFAESHLGINETPGIMILIQRYRMDKVLFALFLIAVLVVWKNAVPLVPPPAPVEGGIATRDHFSGLVNLLQRHVTLADLPEATHREWRRSLPKHGYPGEGKRKQIQQQVTAEMKRAAKQRRPLELYRKISKLLSERNI